MRALLPFVAAAFALPSFAQDVPSGSLWSGGGTSVVVGVGDTGDVGGDVLVQYQDASGWSNGVHGTAGPNNGSPATAQSSMSGMTPSGDSFRIKDGKVQKRISGKPNRPATWINMRRVNRHGKRAAGTGSMRFIIGNEVTSLPF